MDMKQWLSENTHRRITDQDIADILGTTRKTANKRLNDGLSADDLILICGKLGINRTMALVELDYIPYRDVIDYLDSNGQLVATADEGELAIELARRLNPATKAPEIDELAARRSNNDAVDVQPMPYGAVADNSPDEDALRQAEEGDME